MNTKVYTSFQHYDHKGRRLSIFGIPFSDGSGMEIMVITCSKQDQFNKRKGWSYFNTWRLGPHRMNAHQHGFHPELETAPFTKKHEFLRYCNQRFYKVKYHYAPIPGIPIEYDTKGKYGGALLKRNRGVIIKYLGR